jgi:hypothetical protein
MSWALGALARKYNKVVQKASLSSSKILKGFFFEAQGIRDVGRRLWILAAGTYSVHHCRENGRIDDKRKAGREVSRQAKHSLTYLLNMPLSPQTPLLSKTPASRGTPAEGEFSLLILQVSTSRLVMLWMCISGCR